MTGALCVDRVSKREFHAGARAIVLGASTLESQRILMNSSLCGASGVLGRYIFDQFYVKDVVTAIVPKARGGKARRGLMGGGGYIPRFRNLQPGGSKPFLRGLEKTGVLY